MSPRPARRRSAKAHRRRGSGALPLIPRQSRGSGGRPPSAQCNEVMQQVGEDAHRIWVPTGEILAPESTSILFRTYSKTNPPPSPCAAPPAVGRRGSKCGWPVSPAARRARPAARPRAGSRAQRASTFKAAAEATRRLAEDMVDALHIEQGNQALAATFLLRQLEIAMTLIRQGLLFRGRSVIGIGPLRVGRRRASRLMSRASQDPAAFRSAIRHP